MVRVLCHLQWVPVKEDRNAGPGTSGPGPDASAPPASSGPLGIIDVADPASEIEVGAYVDITNDITAGAQGSRLHQFREEAKIASWSADIADCLSALCRKYVPYAHRA